MNLNFFSYYDAVLAIYLKYIPVCFCREQMH